jgi:hypothetical protein
MKIRVLHRPGLSSLCQWPRIYHLTSGTDARGGGALSFLPHAGGSIWSSTGTSVQFSDKSRAGTSVQFDVKSRAVATTHEGSPAG